MPGGDREKQLVMGIMNGNGKSWAVILGHGVMGGNGVKGDHW